MQSGIIKSPVRAWDDIKEAKRFSIQTGRQIIIRLKFPDSVKLLDGHKGKARVLHVPYEIGDMFYPSRIQDRSSKRMKEFLTKYWTTGCIR